MTTWRDWFLLSGMIEFLFRIVRARGARLALTAALTAGLAGCATPKFTVEGARAAAAQGNAQAQYFLGHVYSKGKGVPQDYVQAAAYLRQSAERGYAPAQNDLGALYARGMGVPKDEAQAWQWFRKAADQGDSLGELNVGLCLAWGQGVATNLAEAIEWYQKAARQHEVQAELELGDIFLGGRGLPADWLKSRKWYAKAAGQGSLRAVNALGYICETGGFGVAKDERRAVKYYQRAAIAEDVKGAVNLGRMYLDGTGVQKDVTEAYKWFYLASQLGGGSGNHYLEQLEGRAGYGDYMGHPLTYQQMQEAIRRAKEFQREHPTAPRKDPA
jgi:hypothetical protein